MSFCRYCIQLDNSVYVTPPTTTIDNKHVNGMFNNGGHTNTSGSLASALSACNVRLWHFYIVQLQIICRQNNSMVSCQPFAVIYVGHVANCLAID